MKQKWRLTCGYPPWDTALMSTNFSRAKRVPFITGGVRKSVCRISLLDEARLALVAKQKEHQYK